MNVSSVKVPYKSLSLSFLSLLFFLAFLKGLEEQRDCLQLWLPLSVTLPKSTIAPLF